MRKFTLFLMSLFLTVGAMAQTELDGCYVTFTNVQKNGTEFSLYVNDQGALTISRDAASSLGEFAMFKCELKENGKYTFYNEKAGVYMIWRKAGTGGYDGGDGTIATYNSTYCDWALTPSTNYEGGYYIATQRGDRNELGTLIILSSGVFDAYSNTEGWANNYSNVFRIEVKEVKQTVDVTYEFTYRGEVRDEYAQTVAAEIGGAYPAIMSTFPYGITANKPDGVVEVGDDERVFTIELEENLPFVAAESYESITHWYYMSIHTTKKYLFHEDGQTNIPLTVATKPAAEAKYAWAFVGNPFDGFKIYNYAAGADMILSSSTTMSGSNGGGTYPVMTATPVADGNNTLWVATASSQGTNGFYLAQKGFANNRMNNRDSKLAYWTGGADAGSTFMVERCILPDAYYRVAYDNEGTNYYWQAIASNVKGCKFTTETGAESVWYYGNSKLLSYAAGKYINETGNTRGLQGYGVAGGDVTIAVSSRDASKYWVQCPSNLHFVYNNGNAYGDHCSGDGGHALHDMILENVMSLPVTISDAGYATFYAPVAVKVAEGVIAYAVTIDGAWAILNEIESGVIPANTGVVLQGEADTYNFTVTSTTATVDSDLEGTAAATYITDEAYVLSNGANGVGFYGAIMNQQNNTSWLNNSHKAYLPMSNASGAASYSFRFGEGTTGVENVEVENEVKAIFDLAGRRVEAITAPGIYIVGGKKVLVK
ncbi:MAG: hypothetical protein IIW75_08295 [Bacteroidaceae bacterium]|nr:hypothetical protein [Bacteroidaceae bacterium]